MVFDLRQSLGHPDADATLVTGRSTSFDAAPPNLGADSPQRIRAGFPAVDTRFVAVESFSLA